MLNITFSISPPMLSLHLLIHDKKSHQHRNPLPFLTQTGKGSLMQIVLLCWIRIVVEYIKVIFNVLKVPHRITLVWYIPRSCHTNKNLFSTVCASILGK